jgi:GH25 family lysozyme M1 (1,4-beta-N-acetylmuramidase)
MTYKGIDLSCYNVVKDYEAAAKDNVDFVILKVIRKDLNPDKLFETHWEGFTNQGVPIQGVYNYSYATTVAKFKTDAEAVVKILNGRKTMVWIDIEDQSLRTLGHTLVEGIKEYGKVIKAAGLEFGVYTYISFYNSYLKQYESELDYPFWVAKYPSSAKVDNEKDPDASKRPSLNKTIYGWQWSSSGVVNGISGVVDLNEWYVDIEAKALETATVAIKTTEEKETATDYVSTGFYKEMASLLGLPNGTAKEVLEKTVTISTSKNKSHKSVTALERLMKTMGYYTGSIEADSGKTPVFGNGMAKATALYQSNIVKLKNPDKEWTAKGKSYKTALHVV